MPVSNQYPTFKCIGALEISHPSFRGRQAELDKLEQVCRNYHDAFLLVCGGLQTGKTSLLLRLKSNLERHWRDGVRTCWVDFQSLSGANQSQVYRHIAKEAEKVLPNLPETPDSNETDGAALINFLERALSSDQVKRFVLIFDALTALPETTRTDLAYVLRGLHTKRLTSSTLAKVQCVIAGGIDLYDLVFSGKVSLRNICEIVYLGDLSEAEAIDLIAGGLSVLGIAQAQGHEPGKAVYACVNGHPYLTQRLGEMLVNQYQAGEQVDAQKFDQLAWSLLTNDSLLKSLEQNLRTHKLEDAALRLLSVIQPVADHAPDHIKKLELLGIAHRADNYWRPRNSLFSVALAKWLGLSLPTQMSVQNAALVAQRTARVQHITTLRNERQDIATQLERSVIFEKRSDLQHRLREIETSLTRIEQLRDPTLPTWFPEFIKIPAGPFIMGSNGNDPWANSDEMPQHRLELPDYWISKTPITNAQFRPFVESDGYTNRNYWTEEGWDWCQKRPFVQPEYWDNPEYNGADHPVIGISWFEAVAYCRWLSAQIGITFRLPTEAEWEKAARGPDGRIWPWGDSWDPTACNYGNHRTTRVGYYRIGASPYGVLDMAGNVWEWCATKWQKQYPYQVENEWEANYLKGNVRRALRGGSHSSEHKDTRGSRRLNLLPRNRQYTIGFRIACDFPI